MDLGHGALSEGALSEEAASAGAIALTQTARFDNVNTFYAHALTASIGLTQTARFDNTNTFYTHALTASIGLAQTARFDNTNTFYTHTLSVGGVSLTQTARLDNENTFFEHALSQSGAIPESRQQGAGRPRRKKRERYLARYKGEYYEFETVEDLEAFIEKAKAEEAPKPKKQRAPIKITLSPDFEEEIAPMVNIPPRIEYMPASAALAHIRKIDYTLERFLAEAQRKADEEEAEMEELLMLLL